VTRIRDGENSGFNIKDIKERFDTHVCSLQMGTIQKLLVDHDHQEIIAMNETR
jgi:hypothetical protein